MTLNKIDNTIVEYVQKGDEKAYKKKPGKTDQHHQEQRGDS